ncbi:hypothetical protein [Desulfopila sp. IMCC35008]|uniref:hypothetical protein n=1 Tax=Desulfopila sp. IMCC35008 TaxID=2653858 RepID=UPI0013D4BACD|nr:hypothetical protein [Desulfopila sp. IMCC35008]
MFGMDPAGTFGSALSLFISIFLLIAAILWIFVPFWVWRIRNENITQTAILQRIERGACTIAKDDQRICGNCGKETKAEGACEHCSSFM